MHTRGLLNVVRGRFEAAGLEHPRLYPWDRVHIARRATERTSFVFGEDPRVLAAELGFKLFPMQGWNCGKEWSGDDFVCYAWTPDRRERGLRVFHGIAHCLLRSEGWTDATHADVWLLTLELIAPHAICAACDVADVARESHAPEGVTAEWAQLSRRLGHLRTA